MKSWRCPDGSIKEELIYGFVFEKVLEYSHSLQFPTEQKEYLLDVSAKYNDEVHKYSMGQMPEDHPIMNDPLFARRIDNEVRRLSNIPKVEAGEAYSENISGLRLSKRATKIDVIRIFLALYELRFFEDSKQNVPTQKDFFAQIGKFFNIDLSTYESDLSHALKDASWEKNLKIFDEMKQKMKSKVNDANSRPR